jgi:hypothetical protein
MSNHGSYWNKIGFSSSADEYDSTPPLGDGNFIPDKWTLGNAKKILRKANNEIVRLDPDVLKIEFSRDYLFAIRWHDPYAHIVNIVYGDDATDLYTPYGLTPSHPTQLPTIVMYEDLVASSPFGKMEAFFDLYGEYPARGVFNEYGSGGPSNYSYGYNTYWGWGNIYWGPRFWIWRMQATLWRLVYLFGATSSTFQSLFFLVYYFKVGDGPLGEYTFEKKVNKGPGSLTSYDPSQNNFPDDDTFDPIGTITVSSAF